ncbi:MAG TPA: phenylalanine 4-monooxygenase [Rhizomicrobium sp.]|jgi:phenylalanine-4-hydroxylase
MGLPIPLTRRNTHAKETHDGQQSLCLYSSTGEDVNRAMEGLEKFRERHPEIRADYTIDQHWERYGAAEHGVWRTLYERQSKVLPDRACGEFLDGLQKLQLVSDQIPDLERMSDTLEKITGWRVVAVPSLVPDDVFFDHLANRRFPAGQFIRKPEELDYLEEPDIFHDVFGHVPMLAHPVFADYMQAYGKGGQRALTEFSALKNLARLYWYTVEFGLIEKPEGLRIYGSGIVSSRAESIYAVESPSPNRIHFDLERVMRTNYRIDDFQESYFVIGSFDELFQETYKDFAALYKRLEHGPSYKAGDVLKTDRIHTKGTHTYIGGSHAAE